MQASVNTNKYGTLELNYTTNRVFIDEMRGGTNIEETRRLNQKQSRRKDETGTTHRFTEECMVASPRYVVFVFYLDR